MAKTKSVKSPAGKQKGKVKLSLDVAGLIFKSQAETFKEALGTIYQDSFGKVKTWGVFTLETGGKKAELQLRPIQIKRAFLGRFAQDLLEKRLLMILK